MCCSRNFDCPSCIIARLADCCPSACAQKSAKVNVSFSLKCALKYLSSTFSLRRPKSASPNALAQSGREFQEIKRPSIELLADFRLPTNPGMVTGKVGKPHQYADFARAWPT